MTSPTALSPQRPIIALVAAAGRGTRLGANVPKAFVDLHGISLVERSVRALIAAGCVDEILVLVEPMMEDFATKILEKHDLLSGDGVETPIVKLVHGGGTRAESVWKGLQAIEHNDAVVLIHDAARALVQPDMIARVAMDTLEGNPGVVPVLPVADTITEVDGDQVVNTPDRSRLRAVQTPQGFDLASLRSANEKYCEQIEDDDAFSATDDASIMEWAGETVVTVPGDPLAFKITTPLDLRFAESVLAESDAYPEV